MDEVIMAGIRVRPNVVWATGARKTSGPMRGGPPKALLHATIVDSNTLPGYNNQSKAPHETLLWNMATKRLRPVTHLYFDQYAKALANQAGGVETNADGVLQWELGGYLAETTPRGEFDILTAPNTYWEQVADLIGPIVLSWGVKNKFSRSYTGRRNVRMSMSEWNSWDGMCTHADAPENNHWDLPVPVYAREILQSKIWSTGEEDMPITDAEIEKIAVKVWTTPMTKTGSLPYKEESEHMTAIVARTARNVEALGALAKAQQALITDLLERAPGSVDVEALTARFTEVLDNLTVTVGTDVPDDPDDRDTATV